MSLQMKNVVIAALAAMGVMFFSQMKTADPPPKLPYNADEIQRIQTHEFEDMLAQRIPTSNLAVRGYYTVIEGYIDTCGICKQLERQFPQFLDKREDVVIRKVHFPESGGSIPTSSAEELAAFMEVFGSYRFNHVELAGDAYNITSCGTPHIEVYGPDKELIASDNCSEINDKSGLEFFNDWLAAEL